MTARTVFYLLLYAGLSMGVVCIIDVQMYAVTETAEHTYGTFMNKFTKTFIGCCRLCSQQSSCQSVLYHVTSSECRTNDAFARTGSLPPPDGWKYAEILRSSKRTVAPTGTTVVPTSAAVTPTTTSVAPTTTSVTPTTTSVTPRTTSVAPTATLVTPCSNSDDCSIANTKCDMSTGLCKCEAGHSFNRTLGRCVAACTSYGTTFQSDLGKGFSGNGVVNLSDKTLEECKAACIAETSVTCIVAEYKLSKSDCQLYNGTALTLSSYMPRASVDLYQRDCA